MKIQFPQPHDQRYYEIHYRYILNLLRHGGADVELKVMPEPYLNCGCFPIIVDGRRFMVDYTDGGDCKQADPATTGVPCLRFHCKEKRDRVHPFPPSSFNNWAEYELLSKGKQYCAGTETILFKQRSYGGAVERRDKVRALLVGHYGNCVDTKADDPQHIFFREAVKCFVSVHVPGYCNNMLDRAQFQLMGLGVCTISPRLPEYLPGHFILIDGSHYVRCADDYSDLIQKIEWCRMNCAKCVEIGATAKRLFMEVAAPKTAIACLHKLCAEEKV